MRPPRRLDAAILYCSAHVAAVGSTSPFAYSGIRECAGIGIQHELVSVFVLSAVMEGTERNLVVTGYVSLLGA